MVNLDGDGNENEQQFDNSEIFAEEQEKQEYDSGYLSANVSPVKQERLSEIDSDAVDDFDPLDFPVFDKKKRKPSDLEMFLLLSGKKEISQSRVGAFLYAFHSENHVK